MTAADFRKLADAATPGPWCFERDTNLEALIVFNGMVVAEEIRRDENANFIAACGTERQRIHRALLLLEMIEDDDGTMLRPVSHWLFALDAASKEMETRP
jgi:hypothetical protein